jgi:hypothetical protein
MGATSAGLGCEASVYFELPLLYLLGYNSRESANCAFDKAFGSTAPTHCNETSTSSAKNVLKNGPSE